MNPSKVLASPIELPHQSSSSSSLAGTRDTAKRGLGFVQYGHPYEMFGRFFVGIEPQWSGINAVDFTEDLPITYIKKHNMTEASARVDQLMATSHQNLVNLREAFVTGDTVYFVYERWGISLKEICQLWPVFQLGEVEVATLCNEVRAAVIDLGICN